MRRAVVKKDGVIVAWSKCKSDDEGVSWFNKEYPEGHTVEVIDDPEDIDLAAAFNALDNKSQDFLRLAFPEFKDL